MARRTWCWALSLVMLACSGTDDDPAPVDGGLAPADAGTVRDAGVTDAGEADPDAGIVQDAGLDAGSPDGGPPPLDCSATTLRELTTDTSSTGPWRVGARTASVATGGLVVEVFYPASPEEGAAARKVFDVREQLPVSEQDKISDNDNPWQTCDCYDGLPIDDSFGPYPVILFVHGTGGFRTQSLAQVTHWASRGFVVVAADHPGLYLADVLGTLCGLAPVEPDTTRDLDQVRAALSAPADDLAFLAGHIDLDRLGMAGHSAGGSAIRRQGAHASVLVPMASSGGTAPGAELRSTLVLAAERDQVVNFDTTEAGYVASPQPKRFLALENAGHLAFAGLCSLENAAGQNLVEIGTNAGVCGLQLAGALFDCDATYIPDSLAARIVNDITAGVFEETLHCLDERSETIRTIPSRYEEVLELREAP